MLVVPATAIGAATGNDESRTDQPAHPALPRLSQRKYGWRRKLTASRQCVQRATRQRLGIASGAVYRNRVKAGIVEKIEITSQAQVLVVQILSPDLYSNSLLRLFAASRFLIGQ